MSFTSKPEPVNAFEKHPRQEDAAIELMKVRVAIVRAAVKDAFESDDIALVQIRLKKEALERQRKLAEEEAMRQAPVMAYDNAQVQKLVEAIHDQGKGGFDDLHVKAAVTEHLTDEENDKRVQTSDAQRAINAYYTNN